MGREVRMVPANWEHPKEWNVYRHEEAYRPMHARGFLQAFEEWRNEALPEWLEGHDQWAKGFVRDYKNDGWKPIPWEEFQRDDRTQNIKLYEDYAGVAPASPNPSHYMPDWPEAERTHFMMYEDTTEGTPISPAFATAEELARWLADTAASALGADTATYDQWLATIKRGWAPSMIGRAGYLTSGVAGMADD